MSNLLNLISSPWAITENVLAEIMGVYSKHADGQSVDISKIESQLGRPLNNEIPDIEIRDGVAIISIVGVIAKRMNMFTRISGGVSSEIVGAQIQMALNDDDIKSIVLDIDSPGGTVDGTFELADSIYDARGIRKTVIAVANGTMASAAYAIGAAADQVYMTGETTHVGSIGVVSSHTDYSRREAMLGLKTTEIYAGKFKRIASSYEPLTSPGRECIQDQVDYLYSVFVGRVADFRGVSVDRVLDQMADGRMFIGQQAIDAGLVDGFLGVDEVVEQLSRQ